MSFHDRKSNAAQADMDWSFVNAVTGDILPNTARNVLLVLWPSRLGYVGIVYSNKREHLDGSKKE